MLLEERAESERLRQIIKALQRHRFGRRAESLPDDQLLLGLAEAEQVEAAGHAQAEEAAPTEKTARSAAEALLRIAALYRIEAEIRGRSADERRAVRRRAAGRWW